MTASSGDVTSRGLRLAAPGRGRIILGLALVVWVLASLAGLAWLRLMAGSLLVFLAPGLAVLRLVRAPRGPALREFVLAGALSPLLLGLTAWLVTLTGQPVALAGAAVLGLFLLVVLWPGRAAADRAGEAAPGTAGGEGTDFVVVLVGLLAAGLTAVGYLNPWVRNWSDGWAHAAIFEQIVRSGIPPQFPHFAGHPLPYPWFFHVFLASASGVIHRSPLVLMATLNIWTALLFPLAVQDLARALGARPAACRWAAIAGLVGMNPLGPAWMAAQSFLGATAGVEAWRHGMATTNGVLQALSFRFPFFQASLFGRFWTPTAFNFSIVLMGVVLRLLVTYWERPSLRQALAFALGLALLLVWHPLTALQASVGVAAGVLGALLLARQGERRSAFARAAWTALAGVAAYLLAMPYLLTATGGAGARQMLSLRLSTLNVAGLVLSMGPVFLLAVIGWLWVEPRRRGLAGGLLLGLLGFFLLMNTAGASDEKSYVPLFVLVAGLAGFTLDRMWSRSTWLRAAAALFVLGGVLNAGITARAFVGDHRPVRELFAAVRPGDPPYLTHDEEGALRWIRERTSRDAAFLQYPRSTGPEPILVLGRRPLYLGMAEALYRAVFMPRGDQPPVRAEVWQELKRREALQLAVFSDRALAADSLAMLRSSPRPLLIWWDASLGGGCLSPSLEPAAGATREVFVSPTVRILAFAPER